MTFRFAQLAIAFAIVAGASGTGLAAQRSAADQALYERAKKDCNSPKWSSGARPYIDYSGGWYRCVEPHTK